jgi:hypothetical protein
MEAGYERKAVQMAKVKWQKAKVKSGGGFSSSF